MEDGTDIGNLIVRIAPFLILRHLVMGHRLTLTSELEIEITGRYGSDRGSCRRITFERYIRGGVLSRASPGIEQPHAVSDEPMTVRLAASLHGFQIGILNIGNYPVLIHLDSKRFRIDILVQGIQIVDTLTELITLFRIEHPEYRIIRQFSPDAYIGGFQFVRELLTQILPKHGIMPGKGIYRFLCRGKLRINGILINIPVVFQTSVITHSKNGIIIIEYHVGKHLIRIGRIPECHHHIFHTLVDTGEYIGELVVVAQVIHIEIVCQFITEFLCTCRLFCRT